MEKRTADVVVVGAGGAGLLAALRARETGADVLLVGKAPPGRGTCTAMAAGIFSAASNQGTEQDHLEATLEAGRGINDRGRVDQVVGLAHASIEGLRARGAPLESTANGYRVPDAARPVVPGILLTDWLRRRVLSASIPTRGFRVLDLVVDGGQMAGVLGLDGTDQPVFVAASAVVLATGGAAALYTRHDNPPGITGEGYALALRAGAQLRDMEFVQFYPVGLAQPNLPTFLVYPPYPPGTRLLDGEGRNALADLGGCRDINDAITRFRDTAALLFYRKHKAGGLFIDFSEVTPDLWQSHFCLQRLAKSSFDFRRRPCAIAPLAHFTIGGVEVDEDMETSVPGLFAAGEVTGGLHGANRLGGNALTECVVCGPIAGEKAAMHARKVGRADLPESRVRERMPPCLETAGRGGRPEYRRLLGELGRIAEERAGLVRAAAGIDAGLQQLARIRADLAELPPRDVSETGLHHGLASRLLVLESILKASWAREESRGAFFREDYPQVDEQRWRRSLRLRLGHMGDLEVTSSC